MKLLSRVRPTQARPPYKLLSVLLQYPDLLLDAEEEIRGAIAELPPSREKEAIARFYAYWTSASPTERAQRYVETFDLQKRCGLHLSFYLQGDRRQRGTSLLRLKRLYAAAGLVLEGSERQQMVHPVGHGLHVAVQHRAVGWETETMRLTVYREPFVARELLVGDGGAGGRTEQLRSTTGETRDTGVLHRGQHVADTGSLDAGEMGDLDRGEGLDVDARMALPEALEHLQVIGEPELWVEASYDVELARGVVTRGIGFGEHFVEAACVGAVLPRHTRE